jgi:HTH-type transcriptional regulator, bacterioopsin transcriptional activator and related proteins
LPASDVPETAIAAMVRQQAELAALGQRALAGDELIGVMEDAVALVSRTLDAEHVSLMELNADGDTLRLRAGVGWREGVVGSSVAAVPGGYATYTLDQPEPVVVADLSAETRFEPSALLLSHGVTSSLAVRVIAAGDHPYGVLGVHTTARRAFTQGEIAFVRGLANLLAQVIQRRRQALELNDTVLQGLVVARYALDANDLEQARSALDGVLARAQAIINDMLGGDDEVGVRGLLPGDLRRARAANVAQPDPE